MKLLELKGRTNEIELVFKEQLTSDEAIGELEKLEKMDSFLNPGRIKVSYRGTEFSYNEEMKFEKGIRKIFGEDVLFEKKKLLSNDEIRYSLREDEFLCRVVRKSLRSGEEVSFDGDILVMGDVNPGACVTANGNITVLGALRGTAHIRTKGRVYATHMQPSQIRIGKVYSYNKRTKNVGPAVAMEENGEIIIECL